MIRIQFHHTSANFFVQAHAAPWPRLPHWYMFRSLHTVLLIRTGHVYKMLHLKSTFESGSLPGPCPFRLLIRTYFVQYVSFFKLPKSISLSLHRKCIRTVNNVLDSNVMNRKLPSLQWIAAVVCLAEGRQGCFFTTLHAYSVRIRVHQDRRIIFVQWIVRNNEIKYTAPAKIFSLHVWK